MEFNEFLCDILNKKKEKEMFESPERPHRNLSPYLSWFLSLTLCPFNQMFVYKMVLAMWSRNGVSALLLQ